MGRLWRLGPSVTISLVVVVAAFVVAGGAGCGDAATPPVVVPDAGAAVDSGGTAPDGGADAGAADACDPATVTPPTGCPDDVFTPDFPTEEWRNSTTEYLVVTQGSPNHRCIDMVYNPGQSQLLIGKFAYGIFDKDLIDERVEVWVRLSCSNWTRLGLGLTSDDGEHGTVGGVPDDGGRIYFTVPQDKSLGLGTWPIKMLVKGDHSEANCTLAVWPPGIHAVVSDVDGTLTTRETDGLWTAFDPSSPTPHRGAPETFQAYAAKGYRVIFLTARPEFLTQGTMGWFSDRGFPDALFHLSQSDFGEQGEDATFYKAAFLAGLQSHQGVIVDAVYGNTATDLAAYLQASIAPERIALFAYDGEHQGARPLDDYVGEAARVACLPVVSQP